jgi:hypothetical protein
MVAEAPKVGQRPFLGAVAGARECKLNRLMGFYLLIYLSL